MKHYDNAQMTPLHHDPWYLPGSHDNMKHYDNAQMRPLHHEPWYLPGSHNNMKHYYNAEMRPSGSHDTYCYTNNREAIDDYPVSRWHMIIILQWYYHWFPWEHNISHLVFLLYVHHCPGILLKKNIFLNTCCNI